VWFALGSGGKSVSRRPDDTTMCLALSNAGRRVCEDVARRGAVG